jgi:hypothetical protein
LSFPNPEPSAQPCNKSEEKLQMIHMTGIFSIAKNTHSQVFDEFLANNRGKKKKTVPKFSTKLACLLLGLVLVLSKNPRMNSALALKKKNLSNNSMMLKNIYLFPSFHEIKTSNSASQNPQVPTKTLH